MRVVSMFTALAFATPASAADPYDLACSSKNLNVRYHVDIERGKWCVDECRKVQAIAEVAGDEVFLVKNRVLFTNRPTGELIINTVTGAWRLFKVYTNRIDPLIINGTCKKEALRAVGKFSL